ncbi:MAG TPA: hypothetical protein VG755_08360, partial [Nannocystaceae bacterium]|nr:hypothetical protein [Nannocystaceae bacterium]
MVLEVLGVLSIASLLLFAPRPYEGALEVAAPVEVAEPATHAPPQSPAPVRAAPSPPREPPLAPPRNWVVGAF